LDRDLGAAPWWAGPAVRVRLRRYRQRNVVERCVNRLKQWRGIATRFDKRAANYRAAVVIASLLLWQEA
jgi:transposase